MKARNVKYRLAAALAAFLVLAALALVLAREWAWRSNYAAAGTATPSPDGEWVAEARILPRTLDLGSGIFLRRRWELLRSVHPRLVFVGACEDLSSRWFGQRRLVITCVVRTGEPALLQDLVNDVRIELVVERHFG